MSDIVRYQWIKGEDQGQVEELIESEGKFLKFASGRRCNRELINEFMIEIQHDSDILPLGGEMKVSTKNTTKRKSKPSVLESKPEPKNVQSNPIISILDKSKTKRTKLNIRMEMELPTKEFISVLQESFDDNILEILSGYIVSKIEDPEEFLKEQINNSIKDWYEKS
jgi:hypothetical protein